MKICLFGGTFDPIHLGHLNMIKAVHDYTSPDKIIIIPTGNSYLKKKVSDASHRFRMCELALAYFKDYKADIEISDIEIRRDGPSYTYETLENFKDLYPEDELYWVLGEDSINYIDSWYHPEIILSLAHMLVLGRHGGDNQNQAIMDRIAALKKRFKANIEYIPYNFDISSTEIKAKVNTPDFNYEEYLTREVYEYIVNNGLYSDNE